MTSKRADELFSRIALTTLLLMGFTIVGCGKEIIPKVASDTKTFESATPEIKADWEKTMSAVGSNDYATAILTCRKLQTQSALTPEQRAAVIDTMTAVNNQMTAAAEKGDQNATKAIEELRRRWRSN